MDNPSVVQGKRILDVGSGCGASAIAATKSGAKVVTANDICDSEFAHGDGFEIKYMLRKQQYLYLDVSD